MTILNQCEILDYDLPTWCWIVLIMLGVAAVISSCFTSDTGRSIKACMFIALIVYGVLSIAYFKEEIQTGRYRYECTIDKDTSFVDICEKYDVVEQKGDLWVLEDKK